MNRNLVLVIDDEESVREAVTDILELEGVAALAAANGHEGLALYREQQANITLVLLDLTMPGLSGPETFDGLLTLNPTVRVILSSGYSEEEAVKAIPQRTLAGYIQKPYDIDRFLAQIRQHLA